MKYALIALLLAGCATTSVPPGGIPLTPEQQQFAQYQQMLNAVDAGLLTARFTVALKADEWGEVRTEQARAYLKLVKETVDEVRKDLNAGVNPLTLEKQLAILEKFLEEIERNQ